MHPTDVPHIFHVTLSIAIGGQPWVVIRSLDGTIDVKFEADNDLVSMFGSGEYKILCKGFLDTTKNVVMLGEKIDAPAE